MLRSNRRFILAAIGCVAFSALLWLAFLPRPPELPFYADPQAQAADYQPGGTNCRPEILARLTGQRATSETDRCGEAAEQHRLQANDLTQQARAADASQANVWGTYEATRIALTGLIGGFLTMVAAAFAAFYARRAYMEAERQANVATASHDALVATERAMIEVLRFMVREALFTSEIHIVVCNRGRGPATVTFSTFNCSSSGLVKGFGFLANETTQHVLIPADSENLEIYIGAQPLAKDRRWFIAGCIRYETMQREFSSTFACQQDWMPPDSYGDGNRWTGTTIAKLGLPHNT